MRNAEFNDPRLVVVYDAECPWSRDDDFFLSVVDQTPAARVLDLGCGTGLLLALAQARGATVTGLDVTPGLLEIARDRLPTAELWQADICSLPFGDAQFDVVTGVNVFQFASDPPASLAEAARVVRPGGLVAIGMFAAPERAESTAVHLAMAALSPPRRQADHAPYALTRENLAAALAAAGLEPQAEGEVECVWRYASRADAVRGLIGSAGGTRAVQDAGRAPVRAAIEGALVPFTDPSTGEISMHNAMHWVTARRPARGASGQSGAEGLPEGQHAFGRLVDFDRVAEQGAAGEPVGDRPTHRRRQQRAAGIGQVLAFKRKVAGCPRDVADRAGPGAERAAERGRRRVVQHVQFQQHRAPGGERGAVVQPGRLAAEPEVAQVDVLQHPERAHPEHALRLRHRGVQIVGPVADVMQPAHQLPQVLISGISSAANSRMLASTARGSMPGWWNWMDISSIGRSR